MHIRYDLKKFDEVTVNGREGFVVVPRFQAHRGFDNHFVEFGHVLVKFFGADVHIVTPEDVVAIAD